MLSRPTEAQNPGIFSTRFFFFFNDTATTEIYTLSLHDALPIYDGFRKGSTHPTDRFHGIDPPYSDRKSTRLNSSHANISYAVFCLKKNTTRRSARRQNMRTDRGGWPRPACGWQ